MRIITRLHSESCYEELKKLQGENCHEELKKMKFSKAVKMLIK